MNAIDEGQPILMGAEGAAELLEWGGETEDADGDWSATACGVFVTRDGRVDPSSQAALHHVVHATIAAKVAHVPWVKRLL